MTRYWIGTVSRSHVERGVAGGFAQLNHGKAAPLARMQKGDWLIYYSPKTDMDAGEPLQQFTAIGRLTGDEVYQHRMAPNFVPYRRDVQYARAKPAPIAPLIGKLGFIKDKTRWGFPFRRGHLEISREDWQLIAHAMGVSNKAMGVSNKAMDVSEKALGVSDKTTGVREKAAGVGKGAEKKAHSHA